MNNDSLGELAAENILTLLAFDEKACPILVTALDPKLFGSDIYRQIAIECIEYYKTFKVPANTHLPDLFEKQLEGKNKDKAETYKRILIGLHELKETINREYVLGTLRTFLKQQSLKSAICESYELISNGDIDKAEDVLLTNTKTKLLSTFDAGINLDSEEALGFLDKQETQSFPIGIKQLDDLRIGPARKELFMVMGLPNVGKSRCLVHIGKMLALQRLKVVHISLEMAADMRVAPLYMQAFFGIAKSNEKIDKHMVFTLTDNNKLLSMEEYTLQNVKTFEDLHIKQELKDKIEKLRRTQIVIKEFASGYLTMKMLINYLDCLEMYKGFIPDVLIIDYPGIMKLNAKYKTEELGIITVELRGLGKERNIGIIAAAQANRTGQNAAVPVLTREHIGADFSMSQTADTLITLNQTKEEYELGLMRIFVDKSRNEKKPPLIIISQNPSIGQFCLSSAYMSGNYKNYMKEQKDLDDVVLEDEH